MATACPIPTPEECRYNEVFFRVTDEMKRKIAAVIEETYKDAAAGLQAVDAQEDPPHPEFLVALAEESLMLRMCGATPETDMVGNPALAKGMAQNLLNRAGRWQSILDERAAETQLAT
jgi:hypothetical protein